MKRGEVILVRFPHPSGQRGKKRPAVVVQSDTYASTVSTVVVAEVTKNLTMKNDPACLFIDVSAAEGKASGLLVDSVVSKERKGVRNECHGLKRLHDVSICYYNTFAVPV